MRGAATFSTMKWRCSPISADVRRAIANADGLLRWTKSSA